MVSPATIGGLPKTTYYTPDGRTIKTFPDTRERVIKDKQGTVIWHGTVDANLDRGWLMQPPQILKPYCRGCDRWHDTQAEVDKCIATQEAKLAEAQNKAKSEIAKRVKTKTLR